MHHLSAKIAFLTAAGCLLAGSAYALDGKLVLDRLVQKGVLTQDEADAIVKADAEKQKTIADTAIRPKNPDATEVRLFGTVQVQGKFFTRDAHSGASDAGQTASAGFEARRLDLGVEGKFAGGWNAFGGLEIRAGGIGGNNNAGAGAPAGAELGNNTFAFIDKAGIAYDSGDYGKFTAALQKTKFGLEEYTSSTALYTVERSIVSQYFAGSANSNNGVSGGGYALGIGGRHIGVYWESKSNAKDGGLQVGGGVANAYQGAYDNLTTPQNEQYLPLVYANADYLVLLGGDAKLDFGLNLAYTEANVDQIAVAGTTNTNPNFDTRTYAAEFIAKFTTGALSLIGDTYVVGIDNGRFRPVAAGTDAVSTLPWGVTGTVAYKVSPEFEPLVQLGYIDTNGRGIQDGTFDGAPLNGNGAAPNAAQAAITYARAYSLFVGFNWYITPKSLKLTAGFDGAHFEGTVNTATAAASSAVNREDIYGGRVQLQAVF